MKFSSTTVILDLRNVARNMREVSKDIINTENQNITSRWYHSEKEADLFIWQDEKNNVIKQQVSVHGAVCEWNVIEGVKTGIVLQDDTRSAVEGSEVIQFDQQVQTAALAQAVELLSYVDVLELTEKNHLIDNFKQGKSVSELDPETFLKIYGQKISPVQKNPWHWYFADRLGRWMRWLFQR